MLECSLCSSDITFGVHPIFFALLFLNLFKLRIFFVPAKGACVPQLQSKLIFISPSSQNHLTKVDFKTFHMRATFKRKHKIRFSFSPLISYPVSYKTFFCCTDHTIVCTTKLFMQTFQVDSTNLENTTRTFYSEETSEQNYIVHRKK